MRTRILAIFVGLGLWGIINGQSGFGTFTNYSIKEGLSQSTVTSIFQDRKGFIWLGTSDGLNRFDGQKFTIYKYNYKNPNSISDNWILGILAEDSENNLWILTADGVLNKFNLRTQQFEKFSFGNLKDGRSMRNIYSVNEDKDHNLWISSNLGVLKYNNKKNEIKYYCPISIKDSINEKARFTFSFVDGNKNMWVSSLYGLCRYNYQKDTFIHYPSDPKNLNSLLSEKIVRLISTPDNQTWIITKQGLCKYNLTNDNFTSFPLPGFIDLKTIMFVLRSITSDKKGNIWIGTNQGLLKFSTKSNQYSLYQKNPLIKGSISDNLITQVFIDKNENIWVGTANGLNKYLPETDHFKSCYSIDNQNYIGDIIELKNNEIFVVSDHFSETGIQIKQLNTSKWNLEMPVNNSCDPNNFFNSIVETYVTDKEGNLWLGTFGTGVFKYIPHSNKFTHYLVETENPNSSKNSIWGFTEDLEGNIWFSMYNNGIGKLNPVTRQFTGFYLISSGKFKPFTASTLATDKLGIIWIASSGTGLIRFDTKTSKTRYFINNPKDPNSLSSNYLRSIFIDKQGYIWLATANAGIDKFDPETEKFTHFNDNPGNKYFISGHSTWAVTEDKSGNMWFSIDGSIDCYNPVKNEFTYYHSKTTASTGLITDKALCMLSDSIGNVWFGTSGGGLSKFDYNTKTFSHYTENEGLSNNVIYGITQDNKGNLWLSTNRGISRFNTKNLVFTNYRESDGLQSDEFNQGAFFKSSNGKMYFGGINGFNEFTPENFVTDTIVPSTTIIGLYIADKKIEVKPLVANNDTICKLLRDSTGYFISADMQFVKKLILPYNAKIFSLLFAAPVYNSPEKSLYRYKLENFDDSWHYADETNRATYTNLSPGKYIFKVAVANSDGFWDKKPTTLLIEIVPPFWKTWWFVAMEIILLVSSVIAFIVIRERNLKRSKVKLEAKVKERTHQIEEINEELRLRNYEINRQKEEIAQQAKQLKSELRMQNKISEMALLQAQINPHFLFNTLNNIYSLIYQKSDDAPSAVMKLSELMRYMVYEANSDKVPLEKEINYLKSFIELQLLRLKNKNFVEFNIEGNIYGKTISPMLLIPFVENAFKHGNKKYENPGIIINLVINDENLRFDVLNFYQQNGSFNKDETGGIGIQNVKRRLELIHPNNHVLNIDTSETQFNVHLEISLQ